jgi:hypothetical protein
MLFSWSKIRVNVLVLDGEIGYFVLSLVMNFLNRVMVDHPFLLLIINSVIRIHLVSI